MLSIARRTPPSPFDQELLGAWGVTHVVLPLLVGKEKQMGVGPWPFSRLRSRPVKRRFLSGFRGFEVASEGHCARVLDGPQAGFPRIGSRLHPGELRRLDGRVEERHHLGSPSGSIPGHRRRPIYPKLRTSWCLRWFSPPACQPALTRGTRRRRDGEEL